MDASKCPNFDTCKLVNEPNLLLVEAEINNYIEKFCLGSDEKWRTCKRFIVKNVLQFCPDFILPDNELSIDEIIEEFDKTI